VKEEKRREVEATRLEIAVAVDLKGSSPRWSGVHRMERSWWWGVRRFGRWARFGRQGRREGSRRGGEAKASKMI